MQTYTVIIVISIVILLSIFLVFIIKHLKKKTRNRVGKSRSPLISTSYGRIIKNMVTSIDQKNCNSCWAISTCQCVSDRLRMKGKIINDELNYYSFHDYVISKTDDDDSCNNGALLETGFESFIVYGAPLMSESYDRVFNDSYVQGDRNRVFKVKQWKSLRGSSKSQTIDNMKNELETNGTIVAVMELYDSMDTFDGDLYIPLEHEKSSEMVHMVCIVGYNDNDSTWIVRNSYGTNFGHHGLFKIRQGDVKIGLESEPSAPIL